MRSFDARSKLLLLLIYSITLFFIDSFIGIALYALTFIIFLAISKVPLKMIFLSIVPVYVIVAFTIVFNIFSFDPAGDSIQLCGSLCLSIHGANRAFIYSSRILLLVWMTLVFCYTTTVEDIRSAIDFYISPLARLKLPVDDISLVISIALRFIPQIYQEFSEIKGAQWSRGAQFASDNFLKNIKSYSLILIPLVVKMFLRADSLAYALDIRCYGMSDSRRTKLDDHMLKANVVLITVCLALLFISIAVIF